MSFLELWRWYRRVNDKVFTALVGRSFASFGRHVFITRPTRIDGASAIAIGSGVYIGASSWLQALGGRKGKIQLEIGDGTSIAGNCVLSAAQSVRLGKNVLLARNVYVSDHSHAYADTSSPVLSQGITDLEPVVIDDGAWLAQNVVVCPGVTIGRGAVVGANAVVRDDVPAFSLAVGAPARVIRCFSPTGCSD